MLKRFLLLNGFATIGVVLNHASGWGYTALFWWTDRYWPGTAVPDFTQAGSPAYYGLRTVEQVIAFAIAAFLVVSGFFMAFAARRQGSVSWSTVRTRIWYLLIPYLLWSVGVFVLDALQGTVLAPNQYLRRLITGGAASGYYYVPMLIQIFLLSPLLVRLALRSWKLLLGLTLGIQLAVQFLLYLDTFGVAIPRFLMFWTQSWLFPANLFWFALGIAIGFNLQPFKKWLAQTKKIWLVTAVALIPLGLLEWEMVQRMAGEPFLPTRLTLLDSLYAAAVIFTVLGFENVTPPRASQLSDLGTKSFGVYLANSPVLDTVSRLVVVFIPALLTYQILFQPLLWLAGLGIPLLLMAAMSALKPVRPLYQYIFG